jgi:hypothetical protein
LYEFSLPNGLPSGSRAVWSNLSLRSLVSGPLTPFSYSLLSEIAGRAWYQYFDRLGFDPMPRARVLRQHQGRPYLNLTISAQRDGEGAGIEPLTLRLDGQPFPICKWEKPGLIAGLKFSLAQGKIDALLKSFAGEIPAITQQAGEWRAKVSEFRWTQAEVLQIMEEIENIGVCSFIVWLAARHNLELAYNRLIRLSVERAGFPANLALIDAATEEDTGLVERTIFDKVLALAQMAHQPATLAWLRAGHFDQWEATLPDQTLISELRTFLAAYGHRCIDEGEIEHARWADDPPALFALILAVAEGRITLPPRREAQPQPLLDAIENSRRKEAQQLLQKLPPLHRLQSQALHAFAYILAGTRRWALAAARDAMADQRLLAIEDVFFYELEEMKQMMTGEWNVSARRDIQSTARKRKTQYAEWQQAAPSDLLIGESEAVTPAVETPWSLIGGLTATAANAQQGIMG